MTDDDLLEAAGRLLALRPAASMAELAAAAGVSRATMHRRFPSRAALTEALSQRAVDAYVGAVELAHPEQGSATEAMRRLVVALVDLAPTYGLLVLQPLDGVVEEALLTRAGAADERLRRLVERGQESGDFRVDLGPDWVSTMLTWLVVGAADGVRLGRLAPAAVAALVEKTVLGALRRH